MEREVLAEEEVRDVWSKAKGKIKETYKKNTEEEQQKRERSAIERQRKMEIGKGPRIHHKTQQVKWARDRERAR